jgi:hypothetical protein
MLAKLNTLLRRGDHKAVRSLIQRDNSPYGDVAKHLNELGAEAELSDTRVATLRALASAIPPAGSR